MIVLDTDALIEIFDKHSSVGDDALGKIVQKGDRIAITATLHEIIYGLQKYAKPSAEILQIPVLNYTKEDSRLSAQLEIGAERRGTPVRRTDAMIAAVCINSECEICTFDLKHFEPL